MPGTLISIQENPLPQIHTLTEEEQTAVLDVVRRNIRFIFSGISKQHANKSQSESLVTIRVRNFHETGPDQVNIKQEDGPSLLFYYLFDDWVSSFGLIAKRQHKYGVSLEDLVSIARQWARAPGLVGPKTADPEIERANARTAHGRPR